MVPSKWLAALLLVAISKFVASSAATVTVSSPNFQALTNAVATSTNIQLAFNGTISFPSAITIDRPISIDASNYSVIFQGAGDRFFYIANGGDLTLSSVTLSGGSSPNREPGSSAFGGAILLTNSSLTMNNCRLVANVAQGVQGFISIQYSQGFVTNYSWANSGSGFGGAICARGSKVMLNDCVFENNSANGVDGLYEQFLIFGFSSPVRLAPAPGAGHGGAIDASQCQLEIARCLFTSNRILSGQGFQPVGQWSGYNFQAEADGGALNISSSSVTIRASSFTNNSMSSGPGSSGGALAFSGNYYIENSSFTGNSSSGFGGALTLGGTGLVQRCSFKQNTAIATNGYGDPGAGGAIYQNGNANIDGCVFASNRTVGAMRTFVLELPPGVTFPPQPARGGAIASAGILNVTNCIFFGNSARTGDGGPYGQSPPAGGGAVAILSTYSGAEGLFVHCSFASNIVELANLPDQSLPLEGSALLAEGKLTLVACGLSNPNAVPLVAATNLVDGGFNVSADASPVFTKQSSLNNTDPQFQYLPNAGFSILRPAAGSPLIDRVTAHLTDYDIRGMLRPQTGSDTGAVELAAETPLTITPSSGSLNISAPAFTEPLLLLATSDFKTWVVVGSTNTGSFSVPASNPFRFFRLQFDP